MAESELEERVRFQRGFLEGFSRRTTGEYTDHDRQVLANCAKTLERLSSESGARLSLLQEIRDDVENPERSLSEGLYRELCSATDGETLPKIEVDPSLPDDVFEIRSAGKRYRFQILPEGQ